MRLLSKYYFKRYTSIIHILKDTRTFIVNEKEMKKFKCKLMFIKYTVNIIFRYKEQRIIFVSLIWQELTIFDHITKICKIYLITFVYHKPLILAFHTGFDYKLTFVNSQQTHKLFVVKKRGFKIIDIKNQSSDFDWYGK